jgi:hypothetical protein
VGIVLTTPPEVPPADASPFTLDQARLDFLFGNMRKSLDDWASVTTKALDTALDVNKQLSAFYERLLLLNIGMIGVSVSALLSFGSRAGALGHAKYFIVVFVALAWALLLLSIVLCRRIMMHIITANKKLYTSWYSNALDFNGSVISSDAARVATAMKGTIDVDGVQVDPTARFNELAQMMREKFEEARAVVASGGPQNIDVTTAAGEGKRAIIYMQYALLLMGVAAITLLCRL